ncbi:MAG: phosphodiester glycosidase family protein [Patescibacteria group bacterium]
MFKKLLLFLAFFVIVAGAAYTLRSSVFFSNGNTTANLTQDETEEATQTEALAQEPSIHIVRFSPTNTVAQILYRSPPQFVSEWRGVSAEEIIVNGGYFHEDYSPSGFLVVDGKRVGSRMFDADKSGLLVVQNGRVSIRDLGKFPLKKEERFDGVLQSYPFLIKNSQPGIREDSGKVARRTAIGMDREGMLYIIVVPSREISLFALMNELLATGIPFVSVLNLDGGPSTGISGNWNGQTFGNDSIVPVPSVVTFKKKI